ncbi:type I restriction endonuclease subunit R [Buchananella felis]|uniref:type I restriction endonuclease subunit R n=1 Tax=Buchananella felis TaxID=3231492 RepID=UPI0035291145
MTSSPSLPSVPFTPIVVSNEHTVVDEYVAPVRPDLGFQSEGELEADLIKQLLQQGAYSRPNITNETQLVANLRTQLGALNDIEFTDAEWARFLAEVIANPTHGYLEKTRSIQEDHIKLLTRDDGTTKNVMLLDKQNIHRNRLQVINQMEVPLDSAGARAANRYDVTILVNGLPLVHIELKRRGGDLREAFNQINRYKRETFSAGLALYEYVQIFVISNGTLTKYYSNSTHWQHIDKQVEGGRKATSSNSWEFTSYWAAADNKPINDLRDFAATFLTSHTLLSILTRYCVFDVSRTLLILRPYQIAATERILLRVKTGINNNLGGKIQGGGYIWHTTGSGKTLTSFKTAQLASQMEGVAKVLFVVDRKDLDVQTIKEYQRFDPDCVSGNTSTAALTRQLDDPNTRIVVTTIQKLALYVAAAKGKELLKERVVIIFDECHRSQFGDMHRQITKAFKNYHLFGFTGTPIFTANAVSGAPVAKTTEQVFGDKLHTYTIADAIRDENVLPFKVDYVNTVAATEIEDRVVAGIQSEEALLSPERITGVTSYILRHFDEKTRRSEHYTHKGKRLSGFNALFAVASIKAARLYYEEFKRQMAQLPENKRLRIATVFSYAPNQEEPDGLLPEEEVSMTGMASTDKDFLAAAIHEYNQEFGCNYNGLGAFEEYYKNLMVRIKEREVDLVIVVNMLLTGFDATTLNTLFVDKNLRMHGLMQAYSRTNRILNSVKTFGNIVCFRNLEDATNESIQLFGDANASSYVLLERYEYYAYKYMDAVAKLRALCPPGERPVGEQAEKEFVELMSAILRLRNVLETFDQWHNGITDENGVPTEPPLADLLPPGQYTDYRSVYVELWEKHRKRTDAEKENIEDDLVFEIELVKQVEINLDYVLHLIGQAREDGKNQGEIRIDPNIMKLVDASPSLRSKRDLIQEFIERVTVAPDTAPEWPEFEEEKRQEELGQIVAIYELDGDALRALVERFGPRGSMRLEGDVLDPVLPSLDMFDPRAATLREKVIDALKAWWGRFGNGSDR